MRPWPTLSIRSKVCLSALVVGVLLATAVSTAMERTAARAVEQSSVTHAAAVVGNVRLLRAYYTANVVGRATSHGVVFTHDYASRDGALPLPATLVHELNALEAASASGTGATQRRVRLFSPNPFPWRRDTGGLRDDFDRAAWAAVNARPEEPFWRLENVNGQATVRYAVADRLVDQTCVNCHNSHPQTPRADWQLGDVRGVISLAMPIGDGLAVARSDARKSAGIIIALSAFGLLVVVLYVDKCVLGPIVRLTEATRAIVTGDLSGRIIVTGSDEVGRLATSFDAMVVELGARDQALRRHRCELEQTLDERTRSLATRNAAMRGILDNVEQGLVSVGIDGRMSGESSAILAHWLRPGFPGEAFAACIGRLDACAGRSFESGIWQVGEGFLPTEVAIDQLPKRMTNGAQTLGLAYRPVTTAGRVESILVMVSDVSDEVARARAEGEERELLGVLAWVSKDKGALLDFIDESDALIDLLAGADLDVVTTGRYVHTLKGNSSVFGVERMAAQCEALETTLEANDGVASLEDLAALCEVWFDFRAKVDVIVDKRRSCIEIDFAEYEATVAAVTQQAPPEEVARRMRAWELEPTRLALARLGEQARSIAQRSSRGSLRVRIEDHAMRVDKPRWRSFWSSLVHVVRNTVAHGLETDAERAAANKDPTGELFLETRLEGSVFVVEVGDDGRGIDWEAIRVQAVRRGLRSTSHADLVEALFADGLTTRAHANELCGRGVGLAAARAATAELGGTVSVESCAGQGARFRFTFHADARESDAGGSIAEERAAA